MDKTIDERTSRRLQVIALQGMKRIEEQAQALDPRTEADTLDALNSTAQNSLEAIREIASESIIHQCETIARAVAEHHAEAQRFAEYATASAG